MVTLEAIQRAVALDYGGIDFGIDSLGNIVVFEANATMAVISARSGRVVRISPAGLRRGHLSGPTLDRRARYGALNSRRWFWRAQRFVGGVSFVLHAARALAALQLREQVIE